MSAIDQYRYKCLGLIECPATYGDVLIHREGVGVHVAIYKLLEAIPIGEFEFQGKAGDILLGGGSGEAPALRIAIPAGYDWFSGKDDLFLSYDYNDIVKAYWTMTQAYIFGEGYAKLGWTPTIGLESWLMQHVLSFLARQYPLDYAPLLGRNRLDFDGAICRPLTPDEEAVWNWKDYP